MERERQKREGDGEGEREREKQHSEWYPLYIVSCVHKGKKGKATTMCSLVPMPLQASQEPLGKGPGCRGRGSGMEYFHCILLCTV